MLSSSVLLATPSLLAQDVRCAHARGPWAPVETAPRSALVLSRRGVFRRRASHGEDVIEPGVAFVQLAGQDEEFAHPQHGGDRCTVIAAPDALLASLLGGDPVLPPGALPTSPDADLAHRRFVAAPAEDEGVLLVACVLAGVAPKRIAAGRPATAAARRALAADAREALAGDPSLNLVDLAAAVAASPHHLSRVFAEVVGVPVSTYRRRLRVRAALERLAGGEADLARLAADSGFADHAHLTREVRALLGTTPSELRGEVAGALD